MQLGLDPPGGESRANTAHKSPEPGLKKSFGNPNIVFYETEEDF